MAWDFSTDPEYQEKLDWADTFLREEVEPLDLVWGGEAYTPPNKERRKVLDPLKQRVRDEGLWACHLGADLGGAGYGQLKLALLNEILGRSGWAPIIFGCQAPDTGNAEIIAHYGTDEQKEQYLQPLLNGELFSCYSMTEPQAGADPTEFQTTTVRDGDEWVINGWKFFSSNAKHGVVPHRHGVHRPRGGSVSGHVDVHRAERHAGRGDRPQLRALRRAQPRGIARVDPLPRRTRSR